VVSSFQAFWQICFSISYVRLYVTYEIKKNDKTLYKKLAFSNSFIKNGNPIAKIKLLNCGSKRETFWVSTLMVNLLNNGFTFRSSLRVYNDGILTAVRQSFSSADDGGVSGENPTVRESGDSLVRGKLCIYATYMTILTSWKSAGNRRTSVPQFLRFSCIFSHSYRCDVTGYYLVVWKLLFQPKPYVMKWLVHSVTDGIPQPLAMR
jgi:hypothetical protein